MFSVAVLATEYSDMEFSVNSKMNREFYGRQWMFEKIRDTLEYKKNNERKYKGVSIIGQAGSGKTSICGQLVKPNDNNMVTLKEFSQLGVAYHLCESHNETSLDIDQFIRNLALQLYKHESLANYAKIYDTPEVQNMLKKEHRNEDLFNVFQKVILDPLKSCNFDNETFLLVIDSADESYFASQQKGAATLSICDLLITALQQNLFPKWFCLLITARSKEVIKMFPGLRKITLDDLKKSYVVKDAQQYILDRLDSDVSLRKFLTRTTAEQFNLLHVKSNGCFLYLEKILDNVINGSILIEDVSEIPGTLNGLYLWLCQRLFTEELYTNNLRPVLEILLAARKVLTSNELFNIVKLMNNSIDEEEMQANLNLLSAVLVFQDGACQIFHHSFSDWLVDVKHCTRRFLCNIAKGHAMLAIYYMSGGETLSCQENERFLWHLMQSQYPSSDPTKLDQWLKWSGVKPENASTLKRIKGETTSKNKLLEPKNGLVSNEDEVTIAAPDSDQKAGMVHIDHGDKDWTPLLKAAHGGQSSEVRSLIQHGADVNFINRNGMTALSLACAQGHVKIVHDLINCSAEINVRDCNGCTPLRAAARCGSSDIVTLLLKHGAIPDLADNNERTALRAAAWGGHTAIVLQLLQKGSDVNHMDREGRTALIAAAHTGCVEVVEVLLDYHANINHVDSDGRTALAVCVLSEASQSQLGVVNVLITNGADVDHPDFDGMTPLCLACMLGHKDIVQKLLHAKADINHWDRHGRTPLMLASANGHHEVVKFLLEYLKEHCVEKKETIFRQDNLGWTPLLIAAYNGYESVVQIFLFYGAELDETDEKKKTPLMLAAQQGHSHLVDQLLAAGASMQAKSLEGCTAAHYAAMAGHIDCAEKLIAKGSDVNSHDHHGNTPLNHAAKEGNSKMCEILLKGGAKVNCQDPNGRTPLHIATWKGFYSVVEKLIEYGADVNHTDLMGYTPLMTAAWQGHTPVLSLLLKKNAMVDAFSNKDKATALSIAAQEGHEDVVRLLLNSNASCLTDKFGRDPLKVAQQAGNRGVVQILDSFKSPAIDDGTFTSTLKKQFSRLMKGSNASDSTQSSTPSTERAMQKKNVSRKVSNASSRGKSNSDELENSNTSISSSNDPSTVYDEEYCPSYSGPCGETSSKISSSYSSLKQSKNTLMTDSSLEDSVFFSRSVSRDSFHKTPLDISIGYHGCDAINLKRALEMSSTETTL